MDKKSDKKRDDTMSAATTNYVYKVIVTGNEKPVPVISKEKLDSFKSAIDKYLKKK